jgi:hypothetical protein
VVWRQSFWPLDSLALPVHDMTDWLFIILNPATIGIPQTATHMFQIFAAVACDQLWFSRNKAHHDKIVPNALTISTTINKLVLEHHSAWSSSLIRTPKIWQKPYSSFYKVNYDTAIRPSFSAQAAVLRNISGSVIGCCSLISPPCSALFGEARVALLAARLATSLNITSFILEGDSLTVFLALQNPTITQDWRIASMICHIRSIIPSSTSWSASHINQSANFCAHHVASWVASRLHSGCIPISSPFVVGPSPPCFGKASPSSFFVP